MSPTEGQPKVTYYVAAAGAATSASCALRPETEPATSDLLASNFSSALRQRVYPGPISVQRRVVSRQNGGPQNAGLKSTRGRAPDGTRNMRPK